MLMPNLRESMVRERAHKLWQDAGEPEGQDKMFWDKAGKQIDAEESFGPVYIEAQQEAEEEAKSKAAKEERREMRGSDSRRE